MLKGGVGIGLKATGHRAIRHASVEAFPHHVGQFHHERTRSRRPLERRPERP